MADTTNCTLREAIARAKLNDAANGNDCDPTNSAGADLVIFSFPPEELPAPNTINLVTDGPEDLELVIDDDIIISGPNAGNAADLVINWGEEFLSANSILRLQNTAQSATATITVRNLTISGADGVGQDGGGFKAEADSVVMLDNE